MRTANPALYQSLAERQAGKSDLPYLVYCANCREVFLEQGKECRHILETLLGTCDRVYYLHEKQMASSGVMVMLAAARWSMPPVR